MRRIILFALTCLLLNLPAHPGQSVDESSARMNSAWNSAVIISGDPLHSLGQYVSMAIEPYGYSTIIPQGAHFISYYDTTLHQLWIASDKFSGVGNCGPNQSWFCAQFNDGSGHDIGQFNSIAIYSSPTAWELGIAYHDATEKSLKYAVLLCVNTCQWLFSTIQIAPPDGDVGLATALTFNHVGHPVIAYTISVPANPPFYDNLTLLAYPVTSNGNCGSGTAAFKWQCDKIGSGADSRDTRTVALAIDANDRPLVIYPLDQNPWIATTSSLFSDVLSPCLYAPVSWKCGQISQDTSIGRDFQLVMGGPGNNSLHFAYYNWMTGQIYYMRYVGAGGSCGVGNLWACAVIDTVTPQLDQVGVSLAVDPKGYPWIAYGGVFDNTLMKIARPVAAESGAIGNCGPKDATFTYSWRCDALDTASPSSNKALYLALGFEPGGRAALAYYQGIPSNSTGSYLKFISQPGGSVIYLPLMQH